MRSLSECKNGALILYRDPNGPDGATERPEDRSKRIASELGRAHAGARIDKLLEALSQRLRSQLSFLRAKGWQSVVGTATTKSRVAIGLATGRLTDRPGLAIHPLYGMPYLPASSLKGAVRAFCSENGCTEEELGMAFGREDDRGPGNIHFFDVFPMSGQKGPLVSEDIINKHHKDYYQLDAEALRQRVAVAADYDIPQPVKFLNVPRGRRFLIGCAVKPHATDDISIRLGEILSDALLLGGVGAKTSKAYGRFLWKEG
jgi:CRISPR type III-B/RAMP module RAMP protein Cmr6